MNQSMLAEADSLGCGNALDVQKHSISKSETLEMPKPGSSQYKYQEVLNKCLMGSGRLQKPKRDNLDTIAVCQ